MTITPARADTRNATLQDLCSLLQDQHSRKLDIVAPAAKLHMAAGVLMLDGTEPLITEDGVTDTVGFYAPTSVFDEALSKILSIPLTYLRRMRQDNVTLYDANVNGWLEGTDTAAPDPRKFMVRLFRAGGGEGVARSIHSDSFGRIENLDALVATLQGIRNSGREVEVGRTSLTDRHMYVEVYCPDVAVQAPTLFGNYVSPFTNQSGKDLPIVFAGFVVRNSETGFGAFKVTPRVVAQVCTNGMTMAKDAVRSIHRGVTLDEGVAEWSHVSQQHLLNLISSRTTDAVTRFLNQEYVEGIIAELEEASTTAVSAPTEAITKLGNQLKYDEDTTKGILEHFLMGRDITAGGVLHAVTSYAQTVPDADEAYRLEATAMQAFTFAAKGI